METKTLLEIKTSLIEAWENWGKNNVEFALNCSGIEFAKKQIKRLNAKNVDLIDLRDVISLGFRFANKSRNESFKDFRESGKEINLFAPLHRV